MAAKIDQKAYLQKYLSGSSSGDKKKKKKKTFKGKGLQIIDVDLDISKMRTLDGDELDFLAEGEDAPQVVGIIDERPEEIKKLEQYKTTTKWRVVNQDDGFNSKLQIEEIKKDVKEVQKENEVVFGKMYSDSEEDIKNDSDLSSPRKNNASKGKSKKSSKKQNSDSDVSPPRKNSSQPSSSKNRKDDSDHSPPRKNEKNKKTRNNDSDQSPPRKNEKNKKGRNYDSDESPPRRRNPSPRRNEVPKRKDAERSRKPSRWGQWETEQNNEHEQRKSNRPQTPDSDLSPPRKNSKSDTKHRNESRKPREQTRNKSDTDESPPRKKKYSDKHEKQRQNSDSDQSPPRKNRQVSPTYNSRHDSRKRNPEHRNSNSPPPSNKKMARTLEGKVAGLQDAKQLRQENDAFRKREDEAFRKLGDEVSGRNAKAVSRKSKRETSEDRQKQREKADRQKVLDEKYKKWSKGLKQIEEQESRYQEYVHEASKPLARHANDVDLEDRLKQIERQGDPMLKYMRQKKRENGELGPERPQYKGNFPPNRFNIRPGHRWDGVDRSNGYENKYFQNISKRKANEEEAYKWSTEDL